MIRFDCPVCGKGLKADQSHAGKPARCSGCRSRVDVPEQEVFDDFEIVEEPPARKAVKAVKAVAEESSPRRRQVETPPPRKKKPKKPAAPIGQIVALSAVAVVACVALTVAGLWLRPMAFVLLIVGGLLLSGGTRWIVAIAAEEDYTQHLMCMFVPFYDTWFAYSRFARTWAACLLCWAGRLFSWAGILLLVVHFLRGGTSDRPETPPATPAETDAECERLLKSEGAAEARAWLSESGRRRSFFKWRKEAVLEFVNGLYDRGAVRVSVAGVSSGRAEHLVVELPGDKGKRQAILEFLDARFDDDDEKRADRGQKYELLTPD